MMNIEIPENESLLIKEVQKILRPDIDGRVPFRYKKTSEHGSFNAGAVGQAFETCKLGIKTNSSPYADWHRVPGQPMEAKTSVDGSCTDYLFTIPVKQWTEQWIPFHEAIKKDNSILKPSSSRKHKGKLSRTMVYSAGGKFHPLYVGEDHVYGYLDKNNECPFSIPLSSITKAAYDKMGVAAIQVFLTADRDRCLAYIDGYALMHDLDMDKLIDCIKSGEIRFTVKLGMNVGGELTVRIRVNCATKTFLKLFKRCIDYYGEQRYNKAVNKKEKAIKEEHIMAKTSNIENYILESAVYKNFCEQLSYEGSPEFVKSENAFIELLKKHLKVVESSKKLCNMLFIKNDSNNGVLTFKNTAKNKKEEIRIAASKAVYDFMCQKPAELAKQLHSATPARAPKVAHIAAPVAMDTIKLSIAGMVDIEVDRANEDFAADFIAKLYHKLSA